jgi:hypothetical protein
MRDMLNYVTAVPNVVVEWLTNLLRIQEVPGSNLGSPDLRTFVVLFSHFRQIQL